MIEEQLARVVYQGDGQSTHFAIPFKFITNAAAVFNKKNQIKVFLTDSDGVEKNLEEDKDYQVQEQTLQLLAALKTNQQLIILRDVPLTQDLDLLNGREIEPELLEKHLDKMVMALQEHAEILARAVLSAPTDTRLSVQNMMAQIRTLYGEIKTWADTAAEETQKAIEAAKNAYEQAEKLYSTVEYYNAGEINLNYDGDLQKVTLYNTYKADGHTLKVFVNGALKRCGAEYDYTEAPDPAFTKGGEDYGKDVVFNTPLAEGDALVFMFSDTLTMPGGEVAQAAAQAAQTATQQAQHATEQAQRAQVAADTFLPKQVGEIYFSQSPLSHYNLGAVPAWTGETKTKEEVPALWQFVLDHPERQISAQEYQTMLDEKKSCPFYVLDLAALTLRLPIYRRFIGAVQEDQKIGAFHDTMRKISGEFTTFDRARGSYSGAFKRKESKSANTKSGGSDDWCAQVEFDSATLGENYNGSETQPAHAREYPWIVAANQIDGVLAHNGGVVKVKTYTQAQFNALEEMPKYELSLIVE